MPEEEKWNSNNLNEERKSDDADNNSEIRLAMVYVRSESRSSS